MSTGPTSPHGQDGGGLGAGRHRAWRHKRIHASARPADLPEVSYGCRVSAGGMPAFSPGLYELLRRFEVEGSFAAAADALGVTYEGAWRAVRFCERRLRLRLVRRRAGEAVPGASLTPRGRTILERYAAFARELARMEDRLVAGLERSEG